MKRILISLMLILLITSGCHMGKYKKLKAEDYFEGAQLILAKAIEKGDLEEVKKLAPKVDLNKPAKKEITLLFFALMISGNDPDDNQARVKIITELVKRGADPMQPRNLKEDLIGPAEYAVEWSKGIWIKAMLDGGLSANARSRVLSKSPIIFRSLNARTTETLEVLLDYGADMEAKNSLGETPLYAAFPIRFEHMKLLLERGANPNPIDDYKVSLLSHIKRTIKDFEGSEYAKECEEILKLMIEKGAKDK